MDVALWRRAMCGRYLNPEAHAGSRTLGVVPSLLPRDDRHCSLLTASFRHFAADRHLSLPVLVALPSCCRQYITATRFHPRCWLWGRPRLRYCASPARDHRLNPRLASAKARQRLKTTTSRTTAFFSDRQLCLHPTSLQPTTVHEAPVCRYLSASIP